MHGIIEEFVSYQQRQEEAQGMDAQLMKRYSDAEFDATTSQLTSPEFLEEENEEEEELETEDVEVIKQSNLLWIKQCLCF